MTTINIDGNTVLFVLLDMPANIHGYVVQWDADGYTVFINSKDAKERQQEAAAHELAHILSGDFGREDRVDRIETERHGKDQRTAAVPVYL
jgi:Zn-dependent peptidase ImmA (M78 family)